MAILTALNVQVEAVPAQGWRTSPVDGWSCDQVCTAQQANLTCNVARMNSVVDELTFGAVLAAIGNDPATSPTFACTKWNGGSSSTSAPRYYTNPAGSCCQKSGCYGNTGASATCSATSGTSKRLCCCVAVGDDAATACPVSGSDCGAGTVYDPSAGYCKPCSPLGASQAGTWSASESSCGSCPAGKFGAQSGQTSEATACASSIPDDCLVGTYGSYTTVAMTGCAECPDWGSNTPAGSMHCTGAPYLVWTNAPTSPSPWAGGSAIGMVLNNGAAVSMGADSKVFTIVPGDTNLLSSGGAFPFSRGCAAILRGTDKIVSSTSDGNEVWLSTDKGVSFSKISSSLGIGGGHGCVSTDAATFLVFGGYCGGDCSLVRRSTDGGVSWVSLNTGTCNPSAKWNGRIPGAFTYMPIRKRIVMAGGDSTGDVIIGDYTVHNDVWVSDDGGVCWLRVKDEGISASSPGFVGASMVTVVFGGYEVLLLAGHKEDINGNGVVEMSIDGGANWEPVLARDNVWSDRTEFAFVVDPISRRLLLWGGDGGLSDVWTASTATLLSYSEADRGLSGSFYAFDAFCGGNQHQSTTCRVEGGETLTVAASNLEGLTDVGITVGGVACTNVQIVTSIGSNKFATCTTPCLIDWTNPLIAVTSSSAPGGMFNTSLFVRSVGPGALFVQTPNAYLPGAALDFVCFQEPVITSLSCANVLACELVSATELIVLENTVITITGQNFGHKRPSQLDVSNPSIIIGESLSNCFSDSSAESWSSTEIQVKLCTGGPNMSVTIVLGDLASESFPVKITGRGPATCDPGYFSDENGQCAKCQPGTRGQTSQGQTTACFDCGLGHFSSTPGLTNCTFCSLDTVTDVITDSAKCTPCAVGAIRESKAVYCTACAVGKRKMLNANKTAYECSACSSDEVAPTGSENCARCKPGSVPNENNAACDVCDVGKYAMPNASGTPVCADCALSTYAPKGSINCSSCAVGSFPTLDQGNCRSCTVGTYHAHDGKCSSCPRIGVKCELSSLQILKGFWHPVPPDLSTYKVDQDTKFYPCANEVACIATAPKSFVVTCNTNEGYYGPVCGACDLKGKNFIRNGDGCVECFPTVVSVFLTLGLSLGLLGLMFYYVVIQTLDAGDQRDETGVTVKLLMGYNQMLGILGVFKAKGTAAFRNIVQWPANVGGGGVTSMMFVKCALLSQIYAPFWLTLVAPFVASAVAVLFLIPKWIYERREEQNRKVNGWGTIPPIDRTCLIGVTSSGGFLDKVFRKLKCCTKTMTDADQDAWRAAKLELKKKAPFVPWLRLAVVIIFTNFSLYPSLIASSIGVMRCSGSIDGTKYLVEDFSVVCYDAEHIFHVVVGAIGVVVYALGIPLSAFVLVFAFRREIESNNATAHSSLGFLFAGYSTTRGGFVMSWEAVIMLRKLVITLLSILDLSPTVQILSALLLLAASFALTVNVRPYRNRTMNLLEEGSLCVLFFTQALSLFYLDVTTRELSTGEHDKLTEDLTTLGLIVLNAIAFVVLGGALGIAVLRFYGSKVQILCCDWCRCKDWCIRLGVRCARKMDKHFDEVWKEVEVVDKQDPERIARTEWHNTQTGVISRVNPAGVTHDEEEENVPHDAEEGGLVAQEQEPVPVAATALADAFPFENSTVSTETLNPFLSDRGEEQDCQEDGIAMTKIAPRRPRTTPFEM